ncbi:MAG: ribbon-helix-helix protein, CopG family [Alphaproteobacteria bacterium]|nr:ribbon-helix-helix protein, CopG family [Alphaproteobacteria bacterium]
MDQRRPASNSTTTVTLELNQQQLELIDRTVARGVAPDRAALVRLALREYAAAHAAPRTATPAAKKP